MHLDTRQQLTLHCGSFVFLLFFVSAHTLAPTVFLIALSILAINLWRIGQIAIKEIRSYGNLRLKGSKLSGSSNAKPQNILRFERSIKQAYKDAMFKETELSDSQPTSWNQHYFKQSEDIGELRRMSLTDLRKDGAFRQEYPSRQKGLIMKKIRFKLLSYQQQTDSIKEKVFVQISAYYLTLDSRFNTLKLSKDQIQKCYMIVDNLINSILDVQVDKIITDMQEIQSFLHRCFSLSFAFDSSLSKNTITYSDLIELIRVIDNRGLVPPKFNSNVSMFELKRQIISIKNKMLRMPNMELSPNILRLSLVLKQLQIQFQNEQIIFGDCQLERKPNCEKHIFRIQDDGRFYYHNYSNIKTQNTCTPVLLLFLHILKKYIHSNKIVMQDLKCQLEIP